MMLRVSILIVLATINFSSFAQKKEDMEGMKPLRGFIENNGQVRDQYSYSKPEVKFIFSLPNNNIVLRSNGFSYDTFIAKSNKLEKSKGLDSLGMYLDEEKNSEVIYEFHRVDIEFVGASEDVSVVASEPSYEFLRYYTSDRSEIQARHYGKVTYKNLYPGIDVEFIARPGKNKPIEYNFIVNPGADMNEIQLAYNGANSCKLTNGQLELSLKHGMLRESIPLSYWKQSEKKTDIRYKQIENRNDKIVIGFSGKNERKNETLVIDPTPNLDWATYYGGEGEDIGNAICADNANNLFITGSTTSVNSIATSGSYQSSFTALRDGFLAKFNSAGVRQWATYYGGGGNDYSNAVASDGSGNIYIGGSTLSTDGISTPGAFQRNIANTEESDGFLVKFNASGVRQWGTYIGYDDSESLNGIAIASNGDVYVCGITEGGAVVEGEEGSSSGISTSGSHQILFGGGSNDAFLIKFTPSGARIWGTFYGGTAFDNGINISRDNSDNVILVGSTQSSDVGGSIASPGAHQTALSGISNSFVAKFNSSGIRQWGTYYGGSGGGNAFWGVVSDVSGSVYACGLTSSATSIASAGAHQSFLSGTTDAVIVKFNALGVRQWGTYYGGTNNDFGKRIAKDASSNIYVTGYAYSTNSSSISTPGSYQPNLMGQGDAFVVKFNESGVRQWGTYYGGSLTDDATGICVDGAGKIHITGYTESVNLISTPAAHQTLPGGLKDSFLATFSESTACTAPETNGLAIQETLNICAVKFTTNKLPTCTATYLWNFGDGQTSLDWNPIHVYGAAGTYNVSVQIDYNCPSCQNQITLTKQVVYTPPTNLLEDRVLTIVTDQKLEVIATNASSFSDAWPLNHHTDALSNKGSYLSGSQGVWRNDASYVYKKDRSFSASTNVAKDGTFTMEQFNWKFAELNAVPNWIKANTMTRYSPYSFELENKDVLGVHSSAIYDYGGQLPVANGVNMRHDEMAFTSFEFIDGSVGGNWILNTQSVSDYTTYPILSAGKHLAIVDATLAQLQNVVVIDVIAERSQAALTQNPMTFYQGNEIICMREHPDNPLWTIVVLKTAPIEDYWVGILRIKNVVTPTVVAVPDNTVAHTGKQSLKVTTHQTFRQDLLSLDAGKSYWLNCWVSVNNPYVTTPVLASGLGIDIIARQKNGVVISIFPFTPSGTVIEGWQQLKGSFICPANTAYIEVQFKPGGTGTAWYDDLRFQPENGNMKGYVYNLNDYRLQAVLDEENFASYFYYNREGNLYLTKKETTDGIKTLSENVSYQVER